jgi:hypothetical protein
VLALLWTWTLKDSMKLVLVIQSVMRDLARFPNRKCDRLPNSQRLVQTHTSCQLSGTACGVIVHEERTECLATLALGEHDVYSWSGKHPVNWDAA